MPYAPKMTLQPTSRQDDKLDELIKFLQNNINQQMEMQRFNEWESNVASNKRAEEGTWNALMGITSPEGQFPSGLMQKKLAIMRGEGVKSDVARSFISSWINENQQKEKEEAQLQKDNNYSTWLLTETKTPSSNFNDYARRVNEYGLKMTDNVAKLWNERQQEKRQAIMDERYLKALSGKYDAGVEETIAGKTVKALEKGTNVLGHTVKVVPTDIGYDIEIKDPSNNKWRMVNGRIEQYKVNRILRKDDWVVNNDPPAIIIDVFSKTADAYENNLIRQESYEDVRKKKDFESRFKK